MASLGFLNVDKPAGMTSHDVVNVVRRGTKTKKVGHAGTLDPMATGVLVICWGKATRLSDYVMAGTKSYTATVTLGVETDTYDAEGDVLSRNDATVSKHDLCAVLRQFRGSIQQVPPMYSAIKKGGKKLYELARAGETVEREARPVTIYALELLTFDFPHAHLDVTCSSGTYIRSLAHDVGAALGVGAHLSALRRTAVGDYFQIESAVTLDTLKGSFADENWQQHLVSPADGLGHIVQVTVSADEAATIGNGGFVQLGVAADETLVQAYDPGGSLIALLEPYRARDGVWKPLKVFL
jgi:tRNA pseudouridine55 synthase